MFALLAVLVTPNVFALAYRLARRATRAPSRVAGSARQLAARTSAR